MRCSASHHREQRCLQHFQTSAFTRRMCTAFCLMNALMLKSRPDQNTSVGRCCFHWAACVVGQFGLVCWECARDAAAQLVAALCSLCRMNWAGKLSLWLIVYPWMVRMPKTAMSHCIACCMHHQPDCLLLLLLSSPLPPLSCHLFPFSPKMSTFDVSAMESKSRVLYLVLPFSTDIFIQKKRGGYQFHSHSVIVVLF